MLDVKRMKVLREVGLRGSFSAAAEALAYTQSAVSQQIAALEREAGTTLVERNARGVRLTDAGQVVVKHADAILARLSDAEAELEAMAGLRGGRLRLVSFPSAGATIMPAAIARFRERHPAVELTLNPAEPEDGIAMLKAGEADVALTCDADCSQLEEPGIDHIPLLFDPMYLVMSDKHPLAQKSRVKLADFAADQWILGSISGTCPDALVLMRACQAAGFEPQIAFNSDDYPAIQGFIAAGVGVSLIPDLALVSVRDDIVVRSLGPKAPSRRILAATNSESFASPARQAMVGVLQEVGAEFESSRRSLALAS